jgi:hypothetical protein
VAGFVALGLGFVALLDSVIVADIIMVVSRW